MKRLRLIKPWGLRTVRQHLNNLHLHDIEAIHRNCSGPVISWEDVSYSRTADTNARFTIDADGRSAHRMQMPVSTDVALHSGIGNARLN